jgi:antitoxin component YwqK of YwqJK toxin-antitoxin module
MELARRWLLAGLALTAVACARRCGGLGGQPPIGDAVKVIGPDGQEVLLVDKGAYKAWYDKWGRLGRIEFDKNGDHKPDHIAHYQGGRIARMLEIDENFDGRMDRWEYYEENGALSKVGQARQGGGPDLWTFAGPDGTPRRIEYDDDRDGKIERAELLEKGLVTGVELDTDADGKPDRWQRWVKGKLRGEDLDTNGDGRPDRRLAFDEKGHILGVEKIGQ